MSTLNLKRAKAPVRAYYVTIQRFILQKIRGNFGLKLSKGLEHMNEQV